jgi:hypothetical protein
MVNIYRTNKNHTRNGNKQSIITNKVKEDKPKTKLKLVPELYPNFKRKPVDSCLYEIELSNNTKTYAIFHNNKVVNKIHWMTFDDREIEIDDVIYYKSVDFAITELQELEELDLSKYNLFDLKHIFIANQKVTIPKIFNYSGIDTDGNFRVYVNKPGYNPKSSKFLSILNTNHLKIGKVKYIGKWNLSLRDI